MAYLIIDTSSMLFGFANGRNVFEIAASNFHGRKMLVSAGIVSELNGIAKNRGKRGLSARLALNEIRAKKIGVDNTKEADLWIERRARSSNGTIVITNDTPLARALSRSGVAVYKLSRSGSLKRA